MPAPGAANDDRLPTLAELPPAVRGDVPKIAFGGYMYSPNPADRLVLVDKALRREGEQVAPGLVLEKLLPRGAVMNFRGYRYRVAF
jgi:general secretion pathway protein B